MKTGKIEHFEEKSGAKGPFANMKIDGKFGNCFEGWQGMGVGDVVEYEREDKGKYTNFTIKGKAGGQTQDSAGKRDYGANKDLSIARMNAANNATAILCAELAKGNPISVKLWLDWYADILTTTTAPPQAEESVEAF
jgi:hypothetical protein